MDITEPIIQTTEYPRIVKVIGVCGDREINGVLLHRPIRTLNSLTAEVLKNQVRWLNDFR